MIRDALEKHGVADNTIIIYTSDNGFMCGSHGYGSKVLPYEEASRVPLIIFDPRSETSGKELRSAALTCNIDIAPTLLAIAGVAAPADMDGKNLMKLYEDPSETLHDSIALVNVWGPKQAHCLSVVTQDFKYINWSYAGETFEATEELYHLREDPLELQNLAQHEGIVLEQMRSAYDFHVRKWQDETVSYNHYQEYGTIFDRSVAWEQKENLYLKTKWPMKTKKKKKK